MRQNVRDEVFAFGFSFHQLLNAHDVLGLFKRDLINDQFFESSLVAITSLQGEGIELVVDLCGVIKFKDLFGTADDFIEIESGLPNLLNFLFFSGLYDLFVSSENRCLSGSARSAIQMRVPKPTPEPLKEYQGSSHGFSLSAHSEAKSASSADQADQRTRP